MWGDDNVTNTTTTRYLTPGYALNDIAPDLPIGGAYLEMPRAGTLRNLRVRHNDPGTSSNVITYTLFVNNVATALTVTLAANAVDGADLVNSVVVAAGDRVSIEVTKPANITGGTNARMIVATAEAA